MGKKHKSKALKSIQGQPTGKASPERKKQLCGLVTEIVSVASAGGCAHVKRCKAKVECVLDGYLLRRKITETQHHAGIMFREIYTCHHTSSAHSGTGGTFIYVPNRNIKEMQMVGQLDAHRSLEAVFSRVSTAQRDILEKVCGYDEYAGSHAKLKTLCRALDILAKHWGIA